MSPQKLLKSARVRYMRIEEEAPFMHTQTRAITPYNSEYYTYPHVLPGYHLFCY